jgi:TolB-like protein/DNA-binding winged helix-turn-helix (wHTH) protein/Tfp pilus assembly protein PilF
MPDATQAPAVRRFGAFEINLQSGELRKSGMRLRLSGQPLQVLAVLVERAGEVVTREELHSKLWPADTFVDFDHGLNNAVARIREVLDDSSDTPRYIETIPRRGYRFIASFSDVRPGRSAADSIVVPEDKIAIPGTSVTLGDNTRFGSRMRRVLGGAAVLATLTVALVLYRGSQTRRAGQPAIKSIAVLPLKNLSPDPTQEYLADGMTEELMGRLAGIHELRVISRTSVMRFKGSPLSIPEIAKTLAVDAIVEGSVIREGSHIRVHAQLIRGATDDHFWSETYDRQMGDTFALESELAQSIASRVEVSVTGEERAKLRAAHPVSPEVYESYLKGRFAKGNTKAEVEQSVAYYEDAIRRDPTFAPAYVGLAWAYGTLGSPFVGAPPGEVRPKMVSALRKALELDPDTADANLMLAEINMDQWHWAESATEFKRALAVNPNDAGAHSGFSRWLLFQGHTEEAIAWARRARELDPLGVGGTEMGWILFQARRYDEAIRELRSAAAVHPDDGYAYWFLGFALIANGQADQAIAPLEKARSLSGGSPPVIGVLVRAYAHAGRRTDALRLLNELKRRQQTSYVPTAAFIEAYLGIGDNEQALAWLERAYQEKSDILPYIKVEPFFDPLRGDPRFADLLRRVGLD